MFKDYNLIIVGAGLFGSVMAEQAASAGYRVCVIEQRSHIGGNCYSEFDPETGINVHKYGPHIFHTSNEKIWQYVNRFTRFTQYRHKALSKVSSTMYSIPINLSTINKFYDVEFTPDQAQDFLNSKKVKFDKPSNFEEQALSLVGNDLYQTFIYGYTKKQWGIDPRELPASVARRLPVRTNYNDRYYNDLYEAMPVDGYTPMFENMLSHPNIHLLLGVKWQEVRDQIRFDQLVVYSGPIDQYHDYCFGHLSWRTLDFEFRVEPTSDFHGAAQVNFPEESVPWTREIEHRHFHPERRVSSEQTIIGREFSRAAAPDDVPYYPINTAKDQEILKKYQGLTLSNPNRIIGGRLGEYMYYDMHQVIGSSLSCFKNKVAPILENKYLIN